jgi:hypothetical protein
MQITKPYDNEIMIVNNFTSLEERQKIVKRLNILFNYEENGLSDSEYSMLKSEVTSIMKNLNLKVSDLFYNKIGIDKNIELTDINNFFNISGSGIDAHHDDVRPGNAEIVHYGFVLYHNDDFDGGDLVYVNKNISYKPVAGDLVIHPGTEEYTHAVNDVSNGARFTSTMFAIEKNIEQF